MDKKMFKVVIAGETRMYPEGTTYREIVDESDIHGGSGHPRDGKRKTP